MDFFQQKTKLYHLAAFFLFLFAFLIRYTAIKNINLTNEEAVRLFSFVRQDPGFSSTFLQHGITRLLFFFTGNSYLLARTLNAIFGSLLVMCPFLFKRYLGVNGSLLLSFLLSIDPFFIAHSTLINGQSIILFLAACFAALFLEKEYSRSSLFFLLILFSGQAFGYLLLTCVAIFLFLIGRRKLKVFEIKSEFQNFLLLAKKYRGYTIVAIFVFVILAVLLKIDLSSVISGVRPLLSRIEAGYAQENSPQAYFFVLLSYLPVSVFVLPAIIIFILVFKTEKMKLILLWIVAASIMVIFNPNHRFIDLIWVALPIWIGFSLMTCEIYNLAKNWQKKDLILTVLLLIIVSSTFLLTLSIINRVGSGASVMENILMIIVLFTFFLILLIVYSYLNSIKSALTILGLQVLVIGLFFQMAISARSAGLNHQPQYELLWNGYFSDADIFMDIIEQARYSRHGTRGVDEIAFQSHEDHAQKWLSTESGFLVKEIITTSGLDNKLIINQNEELEGTIKTYRGQRFVKNSYPLWILSPRENIFSHDYWSWLFFRKSKLFNEYNYLWVRTELD